MFISNTCAFAGGDGSLDDPYQVTNVEELQSINNVSSWGDYYYFLVTNDINASNTLTWNSGAGFAPIDLRHSNLNGGGYNISNLHMYYPSDSQIGLIGTMTSSDSVANVILTDCNITGGRDVGGIAGRITQDVAISNCTVSGNITGTNAVNSIVGGIVGGMESSATASYINGVVSVCNIDGDGQLGGAFGQSYANINNSYSNSSVVGSGQRVGGFIGGMYGGTLTNTYSSGSVSTGVDHGGHVGYKSAGTITSSYYDTNVSGFSDTGKGEPKTTAEMQTESTFVNWDFDYTWVMDGYPELQYIASDYIINPVITCPANGTTITAVYPSTTDVVFTWTSSDVADSSTYSLAKDSNYLTTVSSGTTTAFTKAISLAADEYYFRVKYNYNDGTESNYTESQFTINTTTADYGTGIQGVVYRISSDSQIPLSGAKVTVYNYTETGLIDYTADFLTGENGYYLLDGLTAGSYSLQVSKDGYETSSLNSVTVPTDTTVVKDITLEEDNAPNYILPHYTRFVVRSIFGGVYEDVTVNVYEGDSATALFTQTTGSDGAVGFELSETTQYRLTIYSETDNIDTTYTTTPTDDSYNIYVSLIGSSQAQQEADKVLYGMHTDGNELNVTWNDTSGLTTFVDVNVKNRDNTTVYSLNSTESNSYLTQEINTTVNSTYIVELSIESDGLSETFVRSHVISFDTGVKTEFDLGFSAEWQSMFLAALSIIFIAVLFGSANAHLGAILVAVSGLFHVFITGWIPQTILTVAMMFIALIVSVAFYMRKSESI